MAKEKTNAVEREYVIPLRARCRIVPRYKKANKAVKTVKEFLAKHMRVVDRDLNKIKLDNAVNEAIWSRGIKNPIPKVKVKAVRDGENIKVTLVELSKKAIAKKRKLEKRESEVKESKKAKESKETKENEDKDNDGINDKLEEKVAEEASKEETEKEEKEMAKTEEKSTKEEKKKEKNQAKEHLAK